MPIKDIEKSVRWPRIGKINLGVVVPNKSGTGTHPEDVDFFVLHDAKLREVYGERPTALPVLFPSDDIDLIFPHQYERHQTGVLTLVCDGTQAREFTKAGERREFQCQREDIYKDCKCAADAKGSLHVLLPDADFGVYVVPVGGIRPIQDLLGDLRLALGTLGRLAGIEFVIERRPTNRQAPMKSRDGDQTTSTKLTHPVRLRPWMTTRQALALGGTAIVGREQPALAKPAPVQEPAEVTGGDFAPEGHQDIQDAEIVAVRSPEEPRKPESSPPPVSERAPVATTAPALAQVRQPERLPDAAQQTKEIVSAADMSALYAIGSTLHPKIDAYWMRAYLTEKYEGQDPDKLTRAQWQSEHEFLNEARKSATAKTAALGVLDTMCRRFSKKLKDKQAAKVGAK